MSLDVMLMKHGEEVYWANITHNLNAMAAEAGIYKELWRPDEIGATFAGDIVEAVEVGLKKMVDDPAKYESHNSKNGWGVYEHFVPFVAKYLQACRENPDAEIHVSR